jgi:hypothetical protein
MREVSRQHAIGRHFPAAARCGATAAEMGHSADMGTDIAEPTPHQRRAIDRTAPGRVTGRLRKALEAMVWLGLQRKEAAKYAGLADHSLYQALRRSPVRRYYLEQCEVLRVSGRARRLHRLEQLAEQDRNVAGAVAAIRCAEDLGTAEHAPGRAVGPTSAGFVIVVPAAYLPKDRPTIDVTPEVQPPEPEPRPKPTVPPMLRATPRSRR